MSDTQHTSHPEDLKQLETMLERVLNAKGRVKIKTQQPWWWNIFTFLLGCAVTTIGWAWSGKAALEDHMHSSQRKFEAQSVVNDNLSNHVDRSVGVLSSRVNRIAYQTLSKDQFYVWSAQLKQLNQTGTNKPLDIPDIDRIRAQFPLQLE